MRRYFIFILIPLLLTCKSYRNEPSGPKEFSSDLERTEDQYFLTSSGEVKLAGVENRTTQKSHSGNSSILTTQDSPYGLTFEINDLKPDEYYRISVWCYGKPGYGTLVADGIGSEFYRSSENAKTDSMGWHEIRLDLHIPPNPDFEVLKIYVWNNGGDSLFFDDFSFFSDKSRTYPEYPATSTLQLLIDSSDMAQLQALRLRAFERGFLETRDDSYVSVKLVYGTDTLKGNIRFKGDYLSHLEGEKWSFRIKLKKKYSWNGMRTFSLHTPAARDFLDEMIFHDLVRRNDLLATRYGMVPVSLNGKSLGIYAWEEHFTKELPEAMSRREGVIVKFSEDEMWYDNMLLYNNLTTKHIPFYTSSAVVPFQENRVAKNEYLTEQFSIAQDLLTHFKYATKPASEIFEIDKLARFMALTDLMAGYHGMHWHNMRFYYNPVSCRLEPIAFDNYTGTEKSEAFFIARYFYFEDFQREFVQGILGLFHDEELTEKYLAYLKSYSADFDNMVVPSIEKARVWEDMISREFSGYSYAPFWSERVAEINQRIDLHRYFIRDHVNVLGAKDFVSVSENDYEFHPEMPKHLIKVYSEISGKGNLELEIRSFLNQPVTILGYTKDTLFTGLAEKPVLNPMSSYKLTTDEKTVGSITSLSVQTNTGETLTHNIPVFPWGMPGDRPDILPAGSPDLVYLRKHASIQESEVRFPGGTTKINETLIIPSGYNVIIPAGAAIDLVNNAAFISYSPVIANGTASNPVKIFSSDGTGQGFTVIGAKGSCKLSWTLFDQLNTVNSNGWKLTGSVNFYASEVLLDHVTFSNNRSEDALNTINSRFTMKSCTFDNIFSDAFDSDFCTGEISQTTFRDIGNDAIDFSGSTVEIFQSKVLNTGDKGISCGEASRVTLSDVSVQNANIGLASKDQSSVEADHLTIESCTYGLAVFTKKPVFGPATANLRNSVFHDISHEFLIEQGSEASFNNEVLEAKKRKVAKLFYL